MDEPTIRDATPDDCLAIADIYNESIAVGDSTMHDDPRTPEGIRSRMAGFSDREGYLILEREGHVLGWGVIKLYSDRPGYRFCCETSVFLRRSEIQEHCLWQCESFHCCPNKTRNR